MSRKSFFSSLAIVFVMGFGLFAVNSGVFARSAVQANANTNVLTTLHVIEHTINDVYANNDPTGKLVGDLDTFSNPLYDARDKKQVGIDNGNCIRTVVGVLYECNWTIILSGGQISVEGPSYDNADSWLSITGGTGIYKHVSGQMKLHARGNPVGSEYDYIYYFN